MLSPLGANAFTLGRKRFHPWAQTLSPLSVNQQLPRNNVKSAEKNDKSSEKTIATAGRNESVSRGEEDEDCVVQFYYRLMDSNIIGTLFSFYFVAETVLCVLCD